MKKYALILAALLSMGCMGSTTISHQTTPRTEAYSNADPHLAQLMAECDRMEARTVRRLSPTFTVYCN